MSASNHHVTIRTYASSTTGIGHLVRMRHLAAALEEQGVDTLFLLDHPDAALGEMVADLNVCYLQSHTVVDMPMNQQQDAQRVVEQLMPFPTDVVVVDDYRLDAVWEHVVQQAGYRVVVIDDTANRNHQCDLLVDPKWRGKETENYYQKLVPEQCKRLLGPEYALLAPEYRQVPQRCSNGSKRAFRVLLSLGGGGDLNLLADLIESLLQQADYDVNEIEIQAVVGPSSAHRERLQALADQGQVELLVGKQSLFDSYCSASLVVGAAGGSVYELARLRAPVITFSMSENQQTPQRWLDDIGHYLHLPGCSAEDVPCLAQLILQVKGQYSRIEQLFSESRVEVDGRGVERVASEICQLLSDTVCQQPLLVKSTADMEEGTQEYHLRLVEDRDINHYLQSHNLLLNRGNMIEQQVISPIMHYCWWLQTQRTSFLLSKAGEDKLYIWQECIEIMGSFYWIGGWFVCSEGCQYQDALYALSRQLERTDKHYPTVPWIAVISRENHFVKLLNEYQGFTEVERDSERGAVIGAVFPKASFDEFYFVTRDPV